MKPLIIKAKTSRNPVYPEDYRIVFVDEKEDVVGYVNYLKGNGSVGDIYYYGKPRISDKEIVGYVSRGIPDLSFCYDVVSDITSIGEELLLDFANHFKDEKQSFNLC